LAVTPLQIVSLRNGIGATRVVVVLGQSCVVLVMRMVMVVLVMRMVFVGSAAAIPLTQVG
tara:strand:+ start:158 stop:337 length:180 start_codon:yes stop_codon:yes gene_type:complete